MAANKAPSAEVKARRERMAAATQNRKLARRKLQEQREAANKAAGGSAWAKAKELRKAKPASARRSINEGEATKAYFVNKDTPYSVIRERIIRHGVTYTEALAIHNRWTRIGKMAKAGRL